MTINERFEQLGVPTSDDLPADMRQLVERGLEQGRVLCIKRHQIPDPDGVLIWQAEWSFITPAKGKRSQINNLTDGAPPPYNPEDL